MISGQGCTLDWIANLKFEYRSLKLISQLLRNAFMQKSFYVNLKHFPVWFFWIENILGYIWEQFYRFSRGCKPRENLWNCSRKYPKMFETYFIFRQQKIEFKPMSGMIMLLCNRMFCCILVWFFGSNFYLGPLLVWGHF